MALADGSVLASGGATRGQLFHFSADGGAASILLASLPYPVFDLALSPSGALWATTGGGPLLSLDPLTGQIRGQFGDGITQALAIDPAFTDAMHGLARVLQDLERYDEAIEVATKLAELNSDDILAHTSLSILYQKKGMISEAEAEANKARVLGWKKQLLEQKAQQKQ